MDQSRAARPKARFAFKRGTGSRPTTPSGTPGTPGTPGAATPASSVEGSAAGPSGAAGSGSGTGGTQGGKDDGYTISDRSKARLTASDITPSLSPTSSSVTLTLRSLTASLIDLRSAPVRNLHLESLTDCILLTPPGQAVGILAHRLRRCVLLIPECNQFRLHDAENVVIGMGVRSYPVIEGCKGIYTMPCPSLSQLLTGEGGAGEVGGAEGGKGHGGDGGAEGSGLGGGGLGGGGLGGDVAGAEGAGGRGEEINRWNQVQDFDSPTGSSTNWRALTPEEQAAVTGALAQSASTGDVEGVLASITQ